MKYHMEIKLNLGNYQSGTIGVGEADSMECCRDELIADIKRMHAAGLEITKSVLCLLGIKQSDLVD